MKLKDISKWQNEEVRTIQVLSDVCPAPLTLSVRKFVPIPQDSLKKSWMDGKVKKYKDTTPFAIINMGAAVKDMEDYVNSNVLICLVSTFELQLRNRPSPPQTKLVVMSHFTSYIPFKRCLDCEYFGMLICI